LGIEYEGQSLVQVACTFFTTRTKTFPKSRPNVQVDALLRSEGAKHRVHLGLTNPDEYGEERLRRLLGQGDYDCYDDERPNEVVAWAMDLCKAHHVKVIFIRMPEHKLFPRSIEPDFQAFRKKEFGEIPFVDFIKMDFPDSCFADLDHLNYYGARIFTDSFAHYAATIE
jgi:hypothetical protein